MANYNQIDSAAEHILLSLIDKGMNVKRRNRYCFDVEGSRITFHTPERLDEQTRGVAHCDCQFWDHHALELQER